MQKKLNVFVRKTPKNYSAYIEEVNGFAIASKTIHSLEKELLEALQFHIEGLHDYEIQQWMSEVPEFVYHYDMNAFLEKYDGVFNQTNFAKAAGINDSLMRQYVAGLKKPGKKQILKINNNLRKFTENLSRIQVQ